MKVYELKYCSDLFEESYSTISIHHTHESVENELNRLKAIKITEWLSYLEVLIKRVAFLRLIFPSTLF